MSAFRPLAARAALSERLDEPELDPGLLRANLDELAVLNRLPGGAAASTAAIRRLMPGRRADPLSLLDVGTGAADLPLSFVRSARGRGETWQVLAVDRRPEVLVLAGERTAHEPAITLLEADGRHLPLGDRSVDVAHASLLLHHLDPSEAVELLAELRRVARQGVVINDLRRGVAPFVLTAITILAVARSPYTRHDGIASARRAYALSELDALLGAARLRRIWCSSRLAPRVAIAAVPT